MDWSVALLIKNVVILAAVLVFCMRVYRLVVPAWADVLTFLIPSMGSIVLAVATLELCGPPLNFSLFLGLERNWTFCGDLAFLFASFGYGLGLVGMLRALSLFRRRPS